MDDREARIKGNEKLSQVIMQASLKIAGDGFPVALRIDETGHIDMEIGEKKHGKNV